MEIVSIATQSLDLQPTILDAAVSAGVKLFIPSEFGLVGSHPRLNEDFALWRGKVELQARLVELKNEGKIDYYALVCTGLFLDWCLRGQIIDVRNRSIRLYGGGLAPLCMTTMSSIGKAVVAVL